MVKSGKKIQLHLIPVGFRFGYNRPVLDATKNFFHFLPRGETVPKWFEKPEFIKLGIISIKMNFQVNKMCISCAQSFFFLKNCGQSLQYGLEILDSMGHSLGECDVC